MVAPVSMNMDMMAAIVQRLQQDVQENSKTTKELKEQNVDLSQRLARTEECNEELRRNRDADQSRITALDQELYKCSQDRAAALQQAQEDRDLVAALYETVKKAQSAFAAAIEEKERLEQEVARRVENETRLSGTITDLQKAHAELEAAHHALLEERASEREELVRLRTGAAVKHHGAFAGGALGGVLAVIGGLIALSKKTIWRVARA